MRCGCRHGGQGSRGRGATSGYQCKTDWAPRRNCGQAVPQCNQGMQPQSQAQAVPPGNQGMQPQSQAQAVSPCNWGTEPLVPPQAQAQVVLTHQPQVQAVPFPLVIPIGMHNVPLPVGQSGHPPNVQLLYGLLVPQNDEDCFCLVGNQ